MRWRSKGVTVTFEGSQDWQVKPRTPYGPLLSGLVIRSLFFGDGEQYLPGGDDDVVVEHKRVPYKPRLLFSDDVRTPEGPKFSSGEVAKFFFAKSSAWMRWRERDGYFDLDGEQVRPARSEANIRKYSLRDIEKLAYALAQNKAIGIEDLWLTLTLIEASARLHGLIPT